jgi:hypothetical protein
VHEWNLFAAALEQRVYADEFPNVVAFCKTKLPLLRRVIDGIAAKRELFERDAKRDAAFKALSAAFAECDSALDADLATFERALRNLEARFRNGEALVEFATHGSHVETLKKTAREFLVLMREFTANAQRAVSQRAIVASIAAKARTAVMELFAGAVPFRHGGGVKQVTAHTPPGGGKKKYRGKQAVPKHTPPVRGRLFEQPRGVRALPTSRVRKLIRMFIRLPV